MKKNRKFMVAGILAASALIGISAYTYADNRKESTQSNTAYVSTETAVTSKQTSGISAKKAREAALNSAVSKYDIQKSSVRDLQTEQEYENGTNVWEVTFEAKDQNNRYCEFDYSVSCEDGTIIHHDMEYEDRDDQSESEAAETSESKQTNQESGISAKKARKAALNSAVSKYDIQKSSVRDLEIEREYEGGTNVWEVTFEAKDQNNRYCEFDYSVSCEDGTIIHHDMEYEDLND